jgi:G:T-mismatch repair DNA endonuclease (very short patch repair protein)
MFHGNPKKYRDVDYPHPFRKNITAQQIWDKDKRKIEIATREGFEVLVIWDSEYRWGNKKEIVNKCIKFLKNE